MYITIEQISSSGIPSNIPGDDRAGILEDGGVIHSNILYSVYQGSTFSIDIKFKVVYTGILEADPIEYAPIISVTPMSDVSDINLSFTVLSQDTVRISGTAVGVFPGEYFKFLMSDRTIAVLPPINNRDYLALIDYNPPDTTNTSRTYVFHLVWGELIGSLNGASAGESDFSLIQNFYFNYDTSIQSFETSLSKGKL